VSLNDAENEGNDAGYVPDDPYRCPSTVEFPTERIPEVIFLHHAGVLFFSTWMSRLEEHCKESLLKQWLGMVLVDAVNIEQSKYVNWDSLSLLMGSAITGTVRQRNLLGEIAAGDMANRVFELNAIVAEVEQCSDYYYDPHTKQYTGMRKILKGWCSAIRWADKALHSDFIHTSEGMPVYMESCDNYLDLRERFFMVVSNFRQVVKISPEKKITITIDRGIYGLETFQQVQKKSALELISWEKGFKTGEFDRAECNGTFHYSRPRNHAGDVRLHSFSYMDGRWKRDESIRKLIVVATNPGGTSVEVSVLCTDLQRDAQEIILLIFRRWIQENDFKYLDKHYGINEITSYATIPYEQLRETLSDKEEQNAQRKALLAEKRTLEERLKVLLHKEHKRKATILRLTETLNAAIACNEQQKEAEKKKLSTIRSQLTRAKKAGDATTVQKDEYDNQIAAIEKKVGAKEQKVSKLDRLVEEGYERLDVAKKRVMDSVKIFARNIFYRMLAPFKESYNNYRDDHEYFRQFTRAPGFWVQTDQMIVVYLYPAAHMPPRIRKSLVLFLDDLQKEPLVLPDGSGRTFSLQLMPPEGFKLAMA
jgi:hypothetical protein